MKDTSEKEIMPASSLRKYTEEEEMKGENQYDATGFGKQDARKVRDSERG